MYGLFFLSSALRDGKPVALLIVNEHHMFPMSDAQPYDEALLSLYQIK